MLTVTFTNRCWLYFEPNGTS